MEFSELPIPENVLAGIREAGFVKCTPIQSLTLPLTLAGKDVAGQAQTGTGKTAAFLIATFSRLLGSGGKPPSETPGSSGAAPEGGGASGITASKPSPRPDHCPDQGVGGAD